MPGRSIGASATIEPRFRKRPAPGPALPNTTTVPAIMPSPIARPPSPITTTSPRLIRAPASSPAFPRTMISPPVMPRAAPGSAPPTLSPALPRTSIRPPDIASPRSRPTLPSIVSSPPAIPAPMAFTRGTSPSIRTTLECPPRTLKNSPSVPGRPPCTTGSSAISECSGCAATESVTASLMRSSRADPIHDLAEVEMMRPELPAEVRRRNAVHAWPTRRRDAGPHCRLDRRGISPVQHDLEHAVHAVGEHGLGDRPERGIEGIVGRRHHVLVALRAHLAAAPHHAAREREDHARETGHRDHGGLGGGQRGVRILRQDQEIPATHAFQHPEGFLDEELPLHDRQAPVALPANQLARLKPISEHA